MSRFAKRSHALFGLAIALAAVSLTTATARSPSLRVAAAKGTTLTSEDTNVLSSRGLVIPVKGVAAKDLRDNFDEGRGARKHEAMDILAPRGTPVVAAGDGRVAKLFRSAAGGLTVYQFDPAERFIYYYAHLDRYAEGLKEGRVLKRGEMVGYVGTSGNAPKDTPHLHFAIFRAGSEKQWWKGTPLNPYPFLAQSPPLPGS
jgi:murein DD-endopeptidase MepM/ murein hydrolase activator NlpD